MIYHFKYLSYLFANPSETTNFGLKMQSNLLHAR